jgi:hypothetical protein
MHASYMYMYMYIYIYNCLSTTYLSTYLSISIHATRYQD